jgi:hypothetical protein
MIRFNYLAERDNEDPKRVGHEQRRSALWFTIISCVSVTSEARMDDFVRTYQASMSNSTVTGE